ncbi:MAG: hypothetical protein R3B47_15640 [Bacteroidia bacterium]
MANPELRKTIRAEICQKGTLVRQPGAVIASSSRTIISAFFIGKNIKNHTSFISFTTQIPRAHPDHSHGPCPLGYSSPSFAEVLAICQRIGLAVTLHAHFIGHDGIISHITATDRLNVWFDLFAFELSSFAANIWSQFSVIRLIVRISRFVETLLKSDIKSACACR